MPLAFVPLLFLLLPIIEIATFILVGQKIGVAWTLILVVVATMAGLALLRRQGFKAMKQMRAQARGQAFSERRIADGFFKVVAGILLVIPGFVTDAIAILLLIPPVRGLLIGFLGRNITVKTYSQQGFSGKPGRDNRDEDVFDLDPDDFRREPRRPGGFIDRDD